MKKFLTVLLALSVVFTYSFATVGSAFAATDTEKATLLSEAKANAEKAINTCYDEAMKTVKSYKIGDYTESQSAEDYANAWKAIDAKANALAAIQEAYAAEVSGGFAKYSDSYTAEKYADEVFGINYETTDTVSSLTATVAEYIWNATWPELLYNLYTADRAEYLGQLDKIDWSLYSDTKTNDEGKTYLEVAQAKVNAAKEFLADYKVYTLDQVKSDAAAYNTLQTAIDAFEAAVTSGTAVPSDANYNGIEATYYDSGNTLPTGLYKVKDVDTIKDLEDDDRDEAATIATIKAQLQKNYADYMKLADADKEYADNYLALYSYLAEQGQMVLANVNSHTLAGIKATYETKIADAISSVKDLEAFAAKYKAEKDAEGNLVRDPAEVDAVVEKAKVWTYVSAVGATNTVKTEDQITVAVAKAKIEAMSVDKTATDLAFAKEVAKKALDDAKAEVIDNYYPLEAAKVEANYAKILEKIEAATTSSKIPATSGYKATLTSGIKDKTQVNAAVSYANGTAAKADLEAVKAYVAYANSGKNPIADDYIVSSESAIKDALNKVYGEQGARTNTEIAALNVDAATIANSLPTVGGLAAAKKAANDAIAALPLTITTADKAAVVAAWDAKEAYVKLGGSVSDLDNPLALNAAITALKNAMNVEYQIEVIKVDKSDKAALRALLAEIEEANEMVGTDKIFGNTAKFATKTLEDALIAIRNSELKAVKDAINALPINVTLDDKAQIEAARAAYDAFVKEWTVYNAADDYNAAAQVTNFRDLALAEAALSILQKDYAIKAVESLKITASSVAAKGSITVKWKVDGDYSVADGMRVYKSTKKNSGYGATPYFITKKGATQYKNTKELKKGTRYYYKVRAYVEIDGVKYYSDWSNKAYRIAK